MVRIDPRFGARRRPGAHAMTLANVRRVECGFTLDQLAALAQISVRTVKRLMSGEMCEVRAHKRVAAALDADPFELWPNLASDPDVLCMRVSVIAPPKPSRKRKVS